MGSGRIASIRLAKRIMIDDSTDASTLPAPEGCGSSNNFPIRLIRGRQAKERGSIGPWGGFELRDFDEVLTSHSMLR